jgi:hypothetical protein
MNILQTEDIVKGLPDDRLIQEAKQPSGQVPQFLLISEVKRRTDMRKRFENQQAEKPQGTIADQILGGGQQQQQPPGPPGQVAPNMSNPLPTGPGIAPNPNQPPPPQNPNAAIAPQGMARGGIVQYKTGGYITTEIDGQQVQIPTDGYGSDEAAFAAFMDGTNPVEGGGDDYGDSNPKRNPYYRGDVTDAPFGQGSLNVSFNPDGSYRDPSAQALAAPQPSSPQQGPPPPIPPFVGEGAGEGGATGGEGLPSVDPGTMWQRGSRALFGPAFRGIENINAGHKATLDRVQSGEAPVTPRPNAGSLAGEYSYDNMNFGGQQPEKSWDVAGGLRTAANATLGAGREEAGLPTLFDVPEAMRDLSDVPELAELPAPEEVPGIPGAAEEVASLEAPNKPSPQVSGLTDASVQGKTAKGLEGYRAQYLDKVNEPREKVPGLEDMIKEQREAAYSNMLVQLGAGIAGGDMPAGLKAAGVAQAAGNKEARELTTKQRMTQYAADQQERTDQVAGLGQMANWEQQDERMKVEQLVQEGRNINNLRRDRINLIELEVKGSMDWGMKSISERRAYIEMRLQKQGFPPTSANDFPQAAKDHLKGPSGDPVAFDAQFGTGSAEIVLNGG